LRIALVTKTMGGLILFICKESRPGIVGGTRIAGLYIGVQLVYTRVERPYSRFEPQNK
jgi:hypothetical protein